MRKKTSPPSELQGICEALHRCNARSKDVVDGVKNKVDQAVHYTSLKSINSRLSKSPRPSPKNSRKPSQFRHLHALMTRARR